MFVVIRKTPTVSPSAFFYDKIRNCESAERMKLGTKVKVWLFAFVSHYPEHVAQFGNSQQHRIAGGG